MSSQNKRGRRAFGEQPGRRSNDRWDKNIVKLEKPPMRKPVLVRPVGGILTVGVHYVKFKSPRDGQFTGFMTQCPNWNLADQEDQDHHCPICKHFHWGLKIDDKRFEYLKMPQKYRYLFHAFHVTNIMNNQQPTFGVIETHALGIEQIEEAMLLKGAQPDDPQQGFCLNWLRKEAKVKEFNEEIKFSAGDPIPVTEIGDGVWGIKVGGRKIKGVEQDLLAVIPAPPTAKELDKKLADLGLYATLDKVVGKATRGVPAGGSEPDGADWDEAEGDDVDLDVDDDNAHPDAVDAGDDWEDTETEAADPDDDDWEEEEPAEKPARKKAAKKPAAKKPTPEPEEDEWDEDANESADELVEDAPDAIETGEDDDDWGEEEEPAEKPAPKKAAKKPTAKKKAAATPRKKAAKKPEPEPEPDDDSDDDDDDVWD